MGAVAAFAPTAGAGKPIAAGREVVETNRPVDSNTFPSTVQLTEKRQPPAAETNGNKQSN